jgi:hypothetical protein
VLDLSCQDRIYLIECIDEKQKATQRAIDQMKNQQKK